MTNYKRSILNPETRVVKFVVGMVMEDENLHPKNTFSTDLSRFGLQHLSDGFLDFVQKRHGDDVTIVRGVRVNFLEHWKLAFAKTF